MAATLHDRTADRLAAWLRRPTRNRFNEPCLTLRNGRRLIIDEVGPDRYCVALDLDRRMRPVGAFLTFHGVVECVLFYGRRPKREVA